MILWRKFKNAHQIHPDLILAAWPEVIGPKLASMTQAISFENGKACRQKRKILPCIVS